MPEDILNSRSELARVLIASEIVAEMKPVPIRPCVNRSRPFNPNYGHSRRFGDFDSIPDTGIRPIEFREDLHA